MKKIQFSSLAFSLCFLLPVAVSAASTFEVSGWMPYWRAATSSNDVLPHLNELTEINPFVYTMTATGTIVDKGPMDQSPWASVVAAAKAQKVRVIPTIMWSNATAIHTILSGAKTRQALENSIVKLVKTNGYDGIDIDFENKKAETKNYFSLFLKGLHSRMGTKMVTCDIEARTPTDARYYGTTVPPDAEIYANDFVQINKYCDRVHIMAYDQQTVDQQLAAVAASSSALYAPVADPVWVEEVVMLAKKSINPKKIVIGVPTYGYEYDVTAYAGNQYTYDIVRTFDPNYAINIALQYGITPVRNLSGEMTLTYTPVASTSLPLSSALTSGLTAAAAASQVATANNSHLSFRLLDWSDAQSIKSKVALAKALGVRGVAIFEFDGGEDGQIWNVLQGVKE
jgi:spore germination protein YaaH